MIISYLWSFVAHDQLWNLLPIPKFINSTKSNNIPSELYLLSFAELQFNAFQNSLHSSFIISKAPEDYSILFDDTLKNISRIDIKDFTKVIIELTINL